MKIFMFVCSLLSKKTVRANREYQPTPNAPGTTLLAPLPLSDVRNRVDCPMVEFIEGPQSLATSNGTSTSWFFADTEVDGGRSSTKNQANGQSFWR